MGECRSRGARYELGELDNHLFSSFVTIFTASSRRRRGQISSQTTLTCIYALTSRSKNGSFMTEPPRGFDSDSLARPFALPSNETIRQTEAEDSRRAAPLIGAAVGGSIGGQVAPVAAATGFAIRNPKQRRQANRHSVYFDALEEPAPANELSSASEVFEMTVDVVVQEIGVSDDRLHELEQPATTHEKLECYLLCYAADAT